MPSCDSIMPILLAVLSCCRRMSYNFTTASGKKASGVHSTDDILLNFTFKCLHFSAITSSVLISASYILSTILKVSENIPSFWSPLSSALALIFRRRLACKRATFCPIADCKRHTTFLTRSLMTHSPIQGLINFFSSVLLS